MTPALAKRLIIGGMVAIGTLLILAIYLPAFRPDPNNTVEGSAAIGDAFTLTDHTGAEVTEQVLLGRYSLIYFGFTYCPDICPMTLQTVADAIEILPGQKGESVQPVFITLDPKRDTVETISSYVSNFHSSMVGLTGTQDQVQKAADAYRVFFREAPIGDDGDYTIDHSGFLYLMNRSGRYIDHFGKDVTMEDLSARLRELL
ncbi:MAG: SCO family protein [Alphaproteobacteria bacterium]|nr:SCO family protein [Alphaproteobacteria bacterium]